MHRVGGEAVIAIAVTVGEVRETEMDTDGSMETHLEAGLVAVMEGLSREGMRRLRRKVVGWFVQV